MSFKVSVNVFGVYTHGKLAGQTNPKSSITLTMYGDTVKAAFSKINKAVNGAFFSVIKVDDLRPAHIRALDVALARMPHMAA